MATVVLHLEVPQGNGPTPAAQAEALAAALRSLPEVQDVEVDADAATRTLDLATVQTVLAAVTTVKTLFEAVKLLYEFFKGSAAGPTPATIDPQRLFVELDGELVRLIDLTPSQLEALRDR